MSMKKYLYFISNENTRASITSTYETLERYAKNKTKDVEKLNHDELLEFIKIYYSNKNRTTIANIINHLKNLYASINRRSVMDGINLYTIKENIAIKENIYFTPFEIKECIERLPNWQDKALVCLVYIGCYDTNFKTIKLMKEEQVHKTFIETKRRIEISEYVYNILEHAMNEYENISYTTNKIHAIREKNGYLIRSRTSTRCEKKYVSPTALKKKFTDMGKYLGVDGFAPINIKNSYILLNLVKLEFEHNNGMDINQVALKSYLKESDIKGCVELLNMDKKNIKIKIIEDIINGSTKYFL